MNVNASEAIVDPVLSFFIAGDKRRGKIWIPYSLAFFLFTVPAAASNYAGGWEWWHPVSG